MKLPRVSGKEVVKVFLQLGYIIDRQRGSHIILWKDGHNPLTIPNHRELDRGTLHAILKAAGLTVEEFIRLLR